MLEAENGLWSVDRKHKSNSNGTHDYGLCGLNSAYHMDFIKSKDFKDPEKQLKYCFDLYSGYKKKGIIGKRFYGWNSRLKHKSKFYISTTNYE